MAPVIYAIVVQVLPSVLRGVCPCAGLPKPVVTWSLDGTRLLPSPTITIVDNTIGRDDFTFSKLVISNPSSEHSGVYSCECTSARSVPVTKEAEPVTIGGLIIELACLYCSVYKF